MATLMLMPFKFINLFVPKVPIIMFSYWYKDSHDGDWLWHEEKVKISKDGNFYLTLPNDITLSRKGVYAVTNVSGVFKGHPFRNKAHVLIENGHVSVWK